MKKLINSVVIILLAMQMTGQNLNFGLKTPQSAEELPKSKVAAQKAIKVEKKEAKTILQSAGYNEYLLTEGWELQEGNKVIESGNSPISETLNTTDWYNATVPGTVLTTLVNQGIYPDPYFGLNNLSIPETLCRTDWWYRITFDVPADQKSKTGRLLFNGINYRADVWLNGVLIGKINGAFERGLFNISDILRKDKKNILAVHILPPPNPGIPHEENKKEIGANGGQLCLDGPTFISSEGWDWIPGIRDRNIGIWQDVRLLFGSDVSLNNPQIITNLPLPDTTKASISISTEVYNAGNNVQNIEIKGKIENIVFSKSISIEAKQTSKISFTPEEFKQLQLTNPRLWWPNGYGAQNLYTLELSIAQNGQVTDSKSIRFGIRKLSYELMVDAAEKKEVRIEYSPLDVIQKGVSLFDFAKRHDYSKNGNSEIGTLREGILLNNFKEIESNNNPFLVIKVNGQRIFCKGGNWGMDDGIKRVTRNRLEPYFKLHQKENFNMVRNWTAESTEELFYDLADEYGMLVWNDFSISTEGYNLAPNDEPLFLKNVKEIIVRFRNHPCIALWCPRNEGYAPVGLEDGIQQIIATEDRTRHYQGNSRRMNMPWSGPWHYFKNPEDYYKNVAQGFNSELGTLSVPTAETMRKFIAKEDLWPIGDVWYYHDLHYSGHEWKTYLAEIDKLGKQPAANVDEFCNRAQILNYNAHRDMFEAWNHKLWTNTSGVLLWMSHPAWPSVIWQTYSYDYETHGSFYGSKKACEPIHIQWNYSDKKVVAVNTSLKEFKNATIAFNVYATDGKKLLEKSEKVNIASNNRYDGFVGEVSASNTDLVLVRLKLSDAIGSLLSENDYWVNGLSRSELGLLANLQPAVLEAKDVKLTKKGSVLIVSANIKNNSKQAAASIKLNIADSGNGASILPVYASDGYFNLLPGENKRVTFEIPADMAVSNMEIRGYGFNVANSKLADVK